MGADFKGRFNFCERQQVQAEPKIFYYDLLSTQSACGVELHFNGPFCYLQKYNDPLSPAPLQGKFLRNLKFFLSVTCNTYERTEGKPSVEGVNWLGKRRALNIHAGVDV